MNTYSISAELDRTFGEKGTESRKLAEEKAWQEYDAQVLLDARKAAGMTQQALADRLQTSKSYISKVENGLVTPSISTFFRMLNAMGFSIELKKNAAVI